MNIGIESVYIVAALMFGLGLKLLSSPKTARRGNLLSALGMFLAVVATLFNQEVIDFRFIAGGIVLGSIIGVLAARLIAMTAMPEMVALLNGFGGIASLLVGWAEYNSTMAPTNFTAVTIFLAVMIGGVTFSGSVIAWAKLKEFWFGNFGISKAFVFKGQQVFNSLLVLAILATAGVTLAAGPPANARYVMAGGGDMVSSGNFTIRSTVGQAVTGRVTTLDTELCSGFWCTGIRYEVFLPLVVRN